MDNHFLHYFNKYCFCSSVLHEEFGIKYLDYIITMVAHYLKKISTVLVHFAFIKYRFITLIRIV